MASKNFLSSKTLLRALAECGKNSSSDVMVLSLPFEVFKYHDLIEINRFANEIIDDESSENYFSLIVAEDEEQAEELETKKQELNPEDAKKVKIIDVYKAISERTSDKQIDGKKLLITFSGTIDKEGSYKVFDPLLNKIGGIDDQSIINFEQLAIAIVDILNSRGEGEAIEIASDDLAESLKFLSDVYKASENLADSFGALPPSIQWWKHLNLCLKYIEDYDKDLDEDELESLHLSMFGLPCPDNKKNYTKNNTPKAYAMTVKKYWSDHDLIASSIANLKLKKDDGKTSIEDIYDQFEFKKERDNHSYINSAIALCNQYDENGNINTKWLESWLTIEEKDFFHPYPQTKEKKFTVKRNGKKLSSSEIANVTTSKNILYLSIDENIDDLSNDQWILNQINLEYEDRLQKTNDLKITPASIAEWDEIDDSNGILTGNIIIKKPYKRVFKKPIEIELSCEHTRTRDHFRFVAKILITNPCLPSITVAEGKRVTHFNSWEFDFFDGRFETKDETYNDEYKVKNDSERILIEIYDGTKERLVETTESIGLDGSFKHV